MKSKKPIIRVPSQIRNTLRNKGHAVHKNKKRDWKRKPPKINIKDIEDG